MEILKLSIKYDMSMMQNNCEKYLMQSEKCSKIELLVLAEQLGVQKLMVLIQIIIDILFNLLKN
jgi:hypothetical protein